MTVGPRFSPRAAVLAAIAIAAPAAPAEAAPSWTPSQALTSSSVDLIHRNLSASTLGGTTPWIAWQRDDTSAFFGLMGTTIDGGTPTSGELNLGFAVPHTFSGLPTETVGLPSGNGLAAWADESGPTLRISVAEFDGASNAWRTPITLNPYDASAPGTPSAESAPQLSADAQGNVALAYLETTSAIQGRAPSGAHLVLRTRTPGGTWSAPTQLAATPASSRAWRVSALSDGRIVALWLEDVAPSGNRAVVGAVRSAAGEWSTPVVISDPSAYTSVGDAGTLRVTSDARGNSIVAWLNEYDGRGYAADLPAGATSWLPQQRTAIDNGRGTSRAGGRNIALMMNNRGDAAVAWGASIAGPMSIATRERGGSWTEPANQPTVDRSFVAPPLVVQPDGTVIVAGPLFNDTAAGFRKPVGAAGFEAGVPLGPVGEPTDRRMVTPMVGAADADGSLTVAWAAYGPVGSPVTTLRTATYDASGPVHSPISIPETATIDVPALMSVQARDVASGTGETTWAFGDGRSSAGRSARHSYQLPGTYTVTATTKDTLGNARVTTRQIAVRGAECRGEREGTTITVRCDLGFDPGTRVRVNGRIQRVKRDGKVGVTRARTRTSTSTGAFTLRFNTITAARRGLYAVTIAPRGLTKQIVRVRVK